MPGPLAAAGRAYGRGLPLIGGWPAVARSSASWSAWSGGTAAAGADRGAALTSASRNARPQVAAAGQAQMQSQRLAKSVSQALVGGAAAFAEVKEAAEVLAATCAALKDGGAATCLPCRPALQDLVEPLMPLVDRAEKNAAIVLAQQKTLTQVGQALRAINRQSRPTCWNRPRRCRR
jgi:twitching motility protein PilJ